MTAQQLIDALLGMPSDSEVFLDFEATYVPVTRVSESPWLGPRDTIVVLS